MGITVLEPSSKQNVNKSYVNTAENSNAMINIINHIGVDKSETLSVGKMLGTNTQVGHSPPSHELFKFHWTKLLLYQV